MCVVKSKENPFLIYNIYIYIYPKLIIKVVRVYVFVFAQDYFREHFTEDSSKKL